jgi:3'-phosphoadenosine 5'-phosphosulfate sulfotransferase (PAPS reductase)/FAD synthetase
MSNHYKIDGPTCISFSGGRTSAYMLHKVLQTGGGQRPNETIVCFANTGKEDEATLRFVQDCSEHWNVPIVWLEYQWAEKPSDRFKVVTFETASRNGEPFAESIWQNGKPYLPNSIQRICTVNTKIKPINSYLQSIDFVDFETAVGIRADEQYRAAKMKDKWTPLVHAGVTKQDVLNFWETNSFDLGLPTNGFYSNCDLCFMKPVAQIASMIQEKPERAIWWAKQEELAGGRFSKDRPTYSAMMEFTKNQADMFDPNEEAIACFCGD